MSFVSPAGSDHRAITYDVPQMVRVTSARKPRIATVFRGSDHGFLARVARVLFRLVFRCSLYLLIVGRLTV